MFQEVLGRVVRLLTSPKAEWATIAAEPLDRRKLIMTYVAPLAAVPAAATIIGPGLFGPMTLFGAISSAIASFVFSVVWVFVFAVIVAELAPSFGARRDADAAFKVAAFAPSAAWAAGAFHIVPALSILAFVGALYSLYLLYLGIPALMKPAADKAGVYTLAAIGVSILAMLVLGWILSILT